MAGQVLQGVKKNAGTGKDRELKQKQSEIEAGTANLNELDSIGKQIQECREYHGLHITTDEQIAFDLNDGVIVYYAKFGDVLSKL